MSLLELSILTVLLSFCSLVYEMTIAACFVLATGDAPFWQSLTIGLYLASVGLGTWTCSKLARGDAWLWLWRVELALCAAGALSAVALLSIETVFWVRQYFYTRAQPTVGPILLGLAAGHSLTVLIGWLSGFEIPLLLRLAKEADPKGRDRTQEVLGLNYFGALAGSLAFSFWLLPRLDVTGTAAAVSALNFSACVFLYKRKPTPRRAAQLAAVGGFWLAVMILSPMIARLNVASYYVRLSGFSTLEQTCCGPQGPKVGKVLEALSDHRARIDRFPSRMQRIELLNRQHVRSRYYDFFNRRPAAEPGLPYDLSLYLDRHFQFHGASEAVYHEFLAHVPIQLFNRIPRDILILGGGDGLLAKELLKYGDRVRSIVNVELDPAMTQLARQEPRLRRLNNGAFRDEKVEIVVDDAFFFVRGDTRRFDAVYIDLPFPNSYDTAKLYTLEFYRNVAGKLKPGGYVAMDYPLSSSEMIAREQAPDGLRRNSIAVNTLRAAGFWTIVPYSTETPELVPRGDALLMQESPPDPDNDEEIGRLTRQVAARRFLSRHPGLTADGIEDPVLIEGPWQERMLAFTWDKSYPDFSFKDHGITLYSLNAKRLKTLQGGSFPYEENKALVNTVVRPTLFRSLRLVETEGIRTGITPR